MGDRDHHPLPRQRRFRPRRNRTNCRAISASQEQPTRLRHRSAAARADERGHAHDRWSDWWPGRREPSGGRVSVRARLHGHVHRDGWRACRERCGRAGRTGPEAASGSRGESRPATGIARVSEDPLRNVPSSFGELTPPKSKTLFLSGRARESPWRPGLCMVAPPRPIVDEIHRKRDPSKKERSNPPSSCVTAAMFVRMCEDTGRDRRGKCYAKHEGDRIRTQPAHHTGSRHWRFRSTASRGGSNGGVLLAMSRLAVPGAGARLQG